MSRPSRLPIRGSQLLDPGSAAREPRLSKNDNRRTRASSTSRCTNSMTLATPLLKRSRSSASLKRTPQSVRSLRTPSADRQRKKKDERPIQDKKWQSETLRITQEYFKKDPQGSCVLNQGKNIRPLTNNMFVQLVNIVLKNIDEDFEDLTTTNYVELLPKQLTLLMYPGNITTSMMRTANTMHTWPHILAILSWLVNLAKQLQICDEFIDENMYVIPGDLTQEEITDLQVRQLQGKTLVSAFIQWNTGDASDESCKEILDNFTQGLKEIYNYDENTANHLQHCIDKLSRQVKIDEEVIEKLTEQISKAQVEEETLMENKISLDKVTVDQNEYLQKIEARIAAYKRDNKLLREESEKYKLKITEHEKQIKKQPMTKQERDIHVKFIEDLKAKKALFREEEQQLQVVSDESDLRISQMKRTIDQMVSAFNVEVFKVSLKYPELKDYVIDNQNVISEEFFTNVTEKIKRLENFHLELENTLKQQEEELNLVKQQSEKKLEESAKLHEELDTKLVEFTKKKSLREKQLQDFEDDIKARQTENDTIRQEIDELKKGYGDVKPIKEKIREKYKEHEFLKKSKTENLVAMLEIFEKLEKEVTQTIVPEYRAMQLDISRAAVARIESMRPKNVENKK